MVTLDRLVNVLGSYGVRLRFCPIPRSTELRSVVMHELTEDRTVVGDVLLGIGARSVKEAVRWAASARAVVVLIREGDDDDTAFSGAAEGVAVMVVDPATIVERQAPDQLRAFYDARGVYAHLAASDEPLFVTRDPDHGMTGRMVVAVRSGRELMGSVWVECTAPLRGAALAVCSLR